MSTEITHISGYAVITPTPGNTIHRVDAYALFELFPETKITSVVGYYLLEPKNRIPEHKNDTDAILDLINRVSSANWKPGELIISEPVVIPVENGKNTLIEVNDPTGMYLGEQELKYTRRDISESFVELSVPHADSIYELIESLREATGLELSQRDLLDYNIGPQDTEAELIADDGSYFFIPGSTVTVTLIE